MGYVGPCGAGLPRDRIAVMAPLAWTGKWTTYTVKINMDCFKHKDYPFCSECDRKYVPIHKGDTACYRCLNKTTT